MSAATRIFRWAGIYGLIVVAPLYFLEERVGRDQPPPITHPEYYYGFAGVTLAWQILFLIVATDPVRYRPVMLAAIVEKLAWVVAVGVLAASGRVAPPTLGFAAVDLLLAGLFAYAYRRTAAGAPAATRGA
jgi:hypothetical protein